MSVTRRISYLLIVLVGFTIGQFWQLDTLSQDADPSPTPAAVVTPDGPVEVVADDAGRVLDRSANLENWELILAFLLPLVMAVIIRSEWTRPIQAVATFIVAFVAVLVKYALEGGLESLSGDNLVSSLLKVFALAIAYYYGLFKPTQIAPKIQDATNR